MADRRKSSKPAGGKRASGPAPKRGDSSGAGREANALMARPDHQDTLPSTGAEYEFRLTPERLAAFDAQREHIIRGRRFAISSGDVVEHIRGGRPLPAEADTQDWSHPPTL
jgi:hypothetical protein